MYNRSSVIGRAIESCLSQSFGDFELLIVDDASNDISVATVLAYDDSRIRVFQHEMNRGPCPARNTAIEQARGQWYIMLDSDFALLPGALESLYMRTLSAAPDIGNMASSCVWDTGQVTPMPEPLLYPLDYCEYMRWSAEVMISEKLECIRSAVFQDVRYPNTRAWEFQFHLDLAQRWKVSIARDVVAKIFSDAPNRLTTARGSQAVQRVLEDASDKLLSYEAILQHHGGVMRECAPKLYRYTLGLTGNQAFLVGKKRDGFIYSWRSIRQYPWSLDPYLGLLAGMFGHRLTAWATVLRRWARKQ
jgi:glycosyltransferase involved in cell wall biosynthesis